MAVDVVIPKLGMTMSEGTIATWLVDDGVDVTVGQPVYLLVTEKVETEVEAEADGVLHHAVAEGTTLPVGAVVGTIGGDGAGAPPTAGAAAAPAASEPAPAPAATSAPTAGANGHRIKASPNAKRIARKRGIDLSQVRGTGPGGRIVSEDLDELEPVAATPVARRLAEAAGVDLAAVGGTGPRGKVTTEDVRDADRTTDLDESRDERVRLSGMRKVIAERMHGSLQEMAQLTLTMEVTADELVSLRRRLTEEWAVDGHVVPSYTDFVVKAVGRALRLHPLLNSEIDGDELVVRGAVHVGVAVALDDGLVVPVIRNADRLPLAELAATSARFAGAARDRSLGLDDMTDGTFSVTSLGMMGVDAFTPVVNPPNVAILGVGRIRDGVRWDGDQPVRTSAMTLSLSIDHRAVDGAPGAAFLGDVKTLLEAPLRLLA